MYIYKTEILQVGMKWFGSTPILVDRVRTMG